jgi:hypothetical protein
MALEELIVALSEFGEVKQRKRSNVIKVLTDEDPSERPGILAQIALKLSSTVEDTEPGISSIGHVKYDQYRIVVKPKSAQEDGSNGIANEITFVDQLKQLQTPFNLVFTGKNGIVFYANTVVDVKRVGHEGSKADIELTAANNFVYKMSLKKDNAKMWESADTLYAEKGKLAIEKALQSNLVSLVVYSSLDGKIRKTTDGNIVLRLSKEIYTEATPEEKQLTVFGEEGRVCVLKKTFSENDFQDIQPNNTIIVDCSKVYYDIEHLEDTEDDVVFYIRNDCTRNNKKLGLAGIRIIAGYRSRVIKKSEKINLGD